MTKTVFVLSCERQLDGRAKGDSQQVLGEDLPFIKGAWTSRLRKCRRREVARVEGRGVGLAMSKYASMRGRGQGSKEGRERKNLENNLGEGEYKNERRNGGAKKNETGARGRGEEVDRGGYRIGARRERKKKKEKRKKEKKKIQKSYGTLCGDEDIGAKSVKKKKKRTKNYQIIIGKRGAERKKGKKEE
ncbi:hypothetical protein ASPVEDRAFT_638613 [Aspergillus versicolor CBS 583.65]|uniref:Uncharacterized protein n=1 Tax=Aspergillus versicolor CBS 583.65 TaxID=1036611 RepID=A0A1L9PJ24_ASPVE|nr:uncharacterized protein ASPVEDRAFT_638613 [Aspergillus versicolor CBS 583.65]OJJ01491.1 hypothetical protein ASPVEDRAFT_638613 [Aspergillus versicolor CBS 583.65]